MQSSDENLNPIPIHDGIGTEILTNGIKWDSKFFYFKFSNEQNFILFTNTIFKLTFYKKKVIYQHFQVIDVNFYLLML